MKSFEKIAIADVTPPTNDQVLRRLRHEAPCQGNPLSLYCDSTPCHDDYLLNDAPADKACQKCDVFAGIYGQLMVDWEEWVLAQQDIFA